MSEVPCQGAADAEANKLVDVDVAYLGALGGNFRAVPHMIYRDESRAVLAVAQHSGLDIPRGIDRPRLPSAKQAADRLADDPSLLDVHVAALHLSGTHNTGYKVGKGVEKTFGAISFIPRLALSLGHGIAEKRGHPVVAKLTEIATAAVDAPHVTSREATDHGFGRLLAQAHIWARQRYGRHYHLAHHLAPFLWADLLIGMVDHPDRNIGAMRIAGLGVVASVDVMINRGGISVENIPLSLRRLAVQLDANQSIARVIREFDDAEEDARIARAKAADDYFEPKPPEKKYEDFFRPPPSKRPSGEALTALRESSAAYESVLAQPVAALQERLLAGMAGGVLTSQLLDVWTALLERAAAPGPHRQDLILFVSHQHYEMSSLVLSYAHAHRQELSKGTAGISLVRAVADVANQNFVWLSMLPGREGFAAENQRLISALNKAAFDWFDQPLKPYEANEPLKCIVREAYLLSRSQLARSDQHDIVYERVLRFLETIDESDRWLMRAVPARLGPLMRWAHDYAVWYESPQ
jgi:hypothetical protein